MIESLGIWLPHGFHYDDNCNLESEPGDTFYSETVSDHAGGESIVWEFYSPVEFSTIGDYTPGDPMVVDVTFDYTADKTGQKPVSIAWVETSGAVSDILDVTWDIDEDNVDRFPAQISVTAINEPGSLAQIAQIIGESGGNIDNIKMTRQTADFTQMVIDLEVWDLKHLNEIISGLRTKSVVSKVSRIHG